MVLWAAMAMTVPARAQAPVSALSGSADPVTRASLLYPLHPPKPEAVIEAMLGRYLGVRSYQDTGVRLMYLSGDKELPMEWPFKTYFVRPGWFRYEWISEHPYPPLRYYKDFNIVWENPTGVYFYWTLDPGLVERMKSLEQALGQVVGVSHGGSMDIPGLLMKEVGGSALDELQGLSWLGRAECEGVVCDRVRGTSLFFGTYDLWIGVEDHLVRRHETRVNGLLSIEIHREIQTDHEIAATEFEFEPPK